MKLSYIIITALSFLLMACGGQVSNENGHDHENGHGHDHSYDSHEHEAHEDHQQEEFIVNDSLLNKHEEKETEHSHDDHSHEGNDDHQHPHNH